MSIQVNLDDAALRAEVARKSEAALQLLRRIEQNYSPASFANSLGAEDMVLTDLILTAQLKIELFSLDTGRLPVETYNLIDQVKKHYGHNLSLYYPSHGELEAWVKTHGINAFYESLERRKECCHLRKVVPLQRALAGRKAWITGLRSQQSASRETLPEHAFDAANGLEKFNPLAAWTEKEVWAYLLLHKVPYNTLHDRFYPSIGCAPCTRAITPGEDIRSGRWWWENESAKECGLHVQAIPNRASTSKN
ncbi:MAG: phosphoadenylyl-sulfate reductase [Pseudomonadota bacterium]